MAFANSGLGKFLVSGAGRAVRLVAGVLLILAGLLWIGGTWGWVVAAVGLVPALAGLFDFCVFAPLFGAPFWGRDIRALAGKGVHSTR